MIDMTATTKAKSDQLNADDLISGPITVRVTRVQEFGSEQQPIGIHISGGHQPYKPCKTMRRILVAGWGADGEAYVGRSLTLFRNPEVMYGGEKQGGIEISHMSHIKPFDIMLQTTRGKKRKFKIDALTDVVAQWAEKIGAAETLESLKEIGGQLKPLGLNKADAAALREAYRVRESELKAAPEPTDTNRQHEDYAAFVARINARPNGAEATQIKADIESAQGDRLTDDEAAELLAMLSREMAE